MDHPILLIIAANKNLSTESIITNIRKISNEDDVEEFENNKIYVHNIVTKYYETKIALLPIEHFESLNDAVKDKIEGILIYFDSNDRTFLKSLPLYKDFLTEYDIKFSILLCNELMENSNEGITFSCIKSIYNKFDIIELERKSCDDGTLSDAVGYEELHQALQIFPKIPDLDMFDKDDENLEDNDDVEQELEKFENLLTQVMQFRPNTINMSRDDRLNYAQNFAEVFEKLILQEDGGDLSTE